MKTATLSPETEAAVWLRILHPDGELSLEAAGAILQLSFPESEKAVMHELSTKARAGKLTPDEEQRIDVYERAGALLSILKSKARLALKNPRRS